MKKLTSQFIKSLILTRRKKAHKGDFGHVLIIAGSRGMTGAAILCANGALRCGAGLVTAGVPESQQKIVAANIRPEAMTLPLPETDGKFSFKALQGILKFIKSRKVTSLAIGPGIGKSSDITKLVKKLLQRIALPVILDADGLNALSGSIDVFKKAKAGLIITPHPGELSRLSGLPAKKINGNRIKAAEQFARCNKVVCVLKGYGSVVSDGKKSFVNTTGNPGMATGGTGDVLSGMISALTSQVKEPKALNAALCGVFLHGLAGDIAAKKKTRIGLLARDVAESIPEAIKAVGKFQ